ncbi:MAG: F-type H+-transporting ATPase subunit b [Saprospiraceae bacterium]|jgi:F-type H+-transporting ATPase subunit b
MDIIFLADFSPIKPDFGLLFWTTFIFLLFWFMMSRFAFTPIKDALKKRSADIQQALDEAKKAREEMATLKSENEAILTEAREERSKILKEAKAAKDSIINEAKTKAKEEAQRIVTNAIAEIENQKNAALLDVKNQAGMMALAIAEKVIKRQLTGDSEQEKYANSLIDEIKLN